MDEAIARLREAADQLFSRPSVNKADLRALLDAHAALEAARADAVAERDTLRAQQDDADVCIAELRAERDALAEKWSHATATADAVTALTERATACIGGFPVETVAEAVERVVKERDALRAQVTLTDGPCVECGEPTQWAAGNPGLWVVMLPTEGEPGVMRHHHVKCVLGWRAQVEAARADANRWQTAFGVVRPAVIPYPLDSIGIMRLRAEKAEGHAEDARQFFIKERELRLTAEAERDALRAQVAKLEADQHCPTCGSSVYTCVDCDVTPLRAQAERLVAALRPFSKRSCECEPQSGCANARAEAALAAMDGAKPQGG